MRASGKRLMGLEPTTFCWQAVPEAGIPACMPVSRRIRCDRIASDYRGFWYRRGTRGPSPVRSFERIRRLERRRPAREEVQRLCGLRARLCHVDVDRQARIGCELQAVVVEAE